MKLMLLKYYRFTTKQSWARDIKRQCDNVHNCASLRRKNTTHVKVSVYEYTQNAITNNFVA